MTGRLIHLNGAPGVGKSTLARALVASRPGWLNLDIDLLRSLVGGWEADFAGTGSVIRPVALSMVSAHLARGGTVVLPQLLADPVELERFVGAATAVGGAYCGILLDASDGSLAARWRGRDTSDPVTATSNRVIAAGGGDGAVQEWARRLRETFSTRPDVTTIDLEGLDEGAALREVVAMTGVDERGPSRR